jgi:hypothetical protein
MTPERINAFMHAISTPPLRPEQTCNSSNLAAAMVLLRIHQPDRKHPVARSELAIRLARFAFAVWREAN